MRSMIKMTAVAFVLSASLFHPSLADDAVPVTVENFVRAESDRYLSAVALKEDGFGKFEHKRGLSPIDSQTIVRQNRDTLYSAAVFDLDAGAVTITLPDAGKRYTSLQAISEDMYSPPVLYKPGPHTFTRKGIGTRYVLIGVRTLVDPSNSADMAAAHALQDGLKVEQRSPGRFEVPKWEQVSQDKVRKALIDLSTTLTDTRRAFGTKQQVDPIQHLISAAATWGGNPRKDAIYLTVTPPRNDGKTVYRLHVGDVPVDGFWSISLYNADGYFQKNDLDAYSLNNITAKKGADGDVDIQFGGCDGTVTNCLPTMQGWNYTVRLYRPRAEILDSQWTFPEAVASE